MPDPFKTTALLAGSIITIIVGSLVYLRAPKRHANISFFLASFFISLWAVGNAAFLGAHTYQSALMIAKLFYIAPLCAVYLYLSLSLTFPNRELSRFKTALLVMPAITISSLLWFKPEILFLSINVASRAPAIELAALPYAVYSVNILLPIALAIYFMASRTSQLLPVYAQQARILSYGMLVSSPFGLYFNLVLPWFGDYSKVWLGPNAIIFLFIFAAYGILKHRLFVIRRSSFKTLVPILLMIVSLLIYILVGITVMSRLIESNNQQNWKVYFLVITLLTIPYYITIKRFIKRYLFSPLDYSKSISTEVADILVAAYSEIGRAHV